MWYISYSKQTPKPLRKPLKASHDQKPTLNPQKLKSLNPQTPKPVNLQPLSPNRTLIGALVGTLIEPYL